LSVLFPFSTVGGRNPERPEAAPFRVLIVEDHALLASAIKLVLEGEEGISVDGIARRGEEAALLAASKQPAVVLMDFQLPDMTGPAAAAQVQAAAPKAAIVFHNAEESEDALLDAIDAGATAYLTKNATATEMVEAVRRSAVGEVMFPVALFVKAVERQGRLVSETERREKLEARFTQRELDVLRLLAEGHDTDAVADQLKIAPHTVEWHIRHLIEKLGVHSKLQAVIAATRLGLIEL
jgi:two-component system nitrate/nitrite response regulator NarL